MNNENHFTIFIPAYNAEQWAEVNLTSAFLQEYENYDILYIDDCSTDNTENVVRNIFFNEDKEFNGLNKNYIRNSFNKGKMFNLYNYIKPLRDDTIVVIVDGDDWLLHYEVLQTLDEFYNEDIWMTCGSYLTTPGNHLVCPRIESGYWEGNIREKSWEFSHLATFRKSLFDKIKKKHFLDHNGSFLSATSDQAIMWPMAEMSGPEHLQVIDSAMYCYNLGNPLSDHVANRTDQLDLEKYVRSIKPYERLEIL